MAAFILQQLLNGLFQGSIYALIALGYSMIYGVLRFINFAHGDVFMVGAFAAFFTANSLMTNTGMTAGWPVFLLVMAMSMMVCAVLGITIEKLAYRPLRNRPKLNALITAIGVSLLLEYGGQNKHIFGPNYRAFPTLLPETTWNISVGSGSVSIASTSLLILGVTTVLLLLLSHIVLRTRMGMAMRAVSHNAQAATLMGINVDTVISFTFGLGSALAAAAGILYAMKYPTIEPLMGILPGLKAFIAAVIGGIGNLAGAALGGLLLGIIENFIGGWPALSDYRDAISFAILILILLFRPGGLLGKATVEKV